MCVSWVFVTFSIAIPTSIVQSKTVANFTLGDTKYISGSLSNPFVVTPEGYDLWKPVRAYASLFSNAEIQGYWFDLLGGQRAGGRCSAINRNVIESHHSTAIFLAAPTIRNRQLDPRTGRPLASRFDLLEQRKTDLVIPEHHRNRSGSFGCTHREQLLAQESPPELRCMSRAPLVAKTRLSMSG